MTLGELGQVVADGRVDAALERGEWSAALALLRALQQQQPLTPAELELLGRAAYGAGESEAAITA
ncbi:hypothetical protein [Blastococcus saxobsidens]|uniref:Tetratricopeptide repeat protein n=1 Tax=Blastococcus saxobsidens (strain DD2) TaxID=1146883 RepID=H6RIQ4_BLASD|nr:hypothetical protein [Blastococcus saxobsidens]CCG02248.1 protein of unknown function [Blastococcus saxobsidens DD2]